jgi:site-specific DNA recombinase
VIATATATKPVRCAIYTRVSTADQAAGDFSSLDNQRESGEAYVRAHAAQGWEALATRYDDGGFSGASMDRPAVARLLRDVEAGFVDCVVVYKVDRLSRSLLGFARMVEVLDRRGVAFVSVTQQFDTSTSMGKLMQNVLMSFAQFERETIAERTRDKVVAARRRGKWTGGPVPLGYDLVEGRLVPNEEESARVRAMYSMYIEHESLRDTLAAVHEHGWRTKGWTTQRGVVHVGRPFDRTALHRLLTSATYLGKVLCHGKLHDGEHPAIIEQAIWDRVQRLLRANGRNGGSIARNKHGALLAGLLRCRPCDAAMVHSHTRKGSKLYRYYICGAAQRNGWSTCPTKSLPAAEIERVIVERIRAIGRDPELVRATLEAARAQRAEQMRLLAAEITGAEREVKRLRTAPAGRNGNGHGGDAEARYQASAEAEERLAGLQRAYVTIGQSAIDPAELARLLAEFEPIWSVLLPKERARIVRLLIQEVDYDGAAGTVGITFAPTGIKTLMDEAGKQEGEAA